MPLTQIAIDDLKEIHRRKTGEELTDEEAWEMGNRLIRIYDVLTREPESSTHDAEVLTASSRDS